MRNVWPTGGLWRHADFLKLWTGETISQFGSQISQIALPFVAILVLDASAFQIASLPIAYVADVLTLAQLYVVGFLVGICTVFFDVAYQSYLPALVEREHIIEGNSKLEVSRSSAQIAGPGF